VRGGHFGVGLAVVLVMAGCVDAVHERPYRPARANGLASPATVDVPRGPRPSLVLTLHSPAGDGDYDMYRFSMPSSGDNGQSGNVVTGWYFMRGQAAAPLVIIVPIYGSSAYPSWGMTPLGLHYLERAVVRFFVAAFGL
jgi:hypothetical protein